MKRAQNGQRPEEFHAWRKEIKALWYALRLVEQCDSSRRRDIRALQQAERWLGEEHNLVVLCNELSRDAAICQDQVAMDRLRLTADREQCRLREKALARTKHLYVRGSQSYAGTVARAWDKWRRLSR